MAKEILSEVNDRIISLIASFVARGIYNSERDFLIKNGYQTSKLSEIKSQKTNFKLEDVRLILTIEPEVSADCSLKSINSATNEAITPLTNSSYVD